MPFANFNQKVWGCVLGFLVTLGFALCDNSQSKASFRLKDGNEIRAHCGHKSVVQNLIPNQEYWLVREEERAFASWELLSDSKAVAIQFYGSNLETVKIVAPHSNIEYTLKRGVFIK
ncbi:MAG: hypothetical protein KBC12_01500 [Candidatus Pacebacteria bacterium]|nr:hypothetical protein [Candidatus Paceibacterota bacterium]MBP9851483.1 hypothetical protein [Candidatus Paceibacterota bacterium]